MSDPERAQWEALAPRLEAARQQVEGILGQLKGLIDPAVSAVNRISSSHSARVNQAATGLTAAANEFMEFIYTIFRSIRATFMLWPYRDAWRSILEKATDVAASVKDHNVRADDHWAGDARTAYYQLTYAQSGAAERIGVLAEKVADSLYECAKAMLVFWIAILALIARFLWAIRFVIIGFVRLIALVVAGTVVGGPPGAVATFLIGAALLLVSMKNALAAATQLRTLGVAAFLALGNALVQAMDQADGLLRQAQNRTAFPGGRWPSPPVAIFDGQTIGSRWHRPTDQPNIETIVQEVIARRAAPPPP